MEDKVIVTADAEEDLKQYIRYLLMVEYPIYTTPESYI